MLDVLLQMRAPENQPQCELLGSLLLDVLRQPLNLLDPKVFLR